jgi:hypothetical protein
MLSPDDIALLRRLPNVWHDIPMHRPSVSPSILRALERFEALRVAGYVTVGRSFPGNRRFDLHVALTFDGAEAVAKHEAARGRGR